MQGRKLFEPGMTASEAAESVRGGLRPLSDPDALKAAIYPWLHFTSKRAQVAQWGVPDFSDVPELLDDCRAQFPPPKWSAKAFKKSEMDEARTTSFSDDMIRDVRLVGKSDREAGHVCFVLPLSINMNGRPMPIHYHWRAPIFHGYGLIIDGFKGTESEIGLRWGIGVTQKGIAEDFSVPEKVLTGQKSVASAHNVWQRYSKSVSGETEYLRTPYYPQAAEEEPWLLYLSGAFIGFDGAVIDSVGTVYHMSFGSCHVPLGGSDRALLDFQDRALDYVETKIEDLRVRNVPVYDKVLVLKQKFDDRVYHQIVEICSRIFPWLEVARQNDIKILVGNQSPLLEEWFDFVGIKRENLVVAYGDYKIYGREVYLPRPTPCFTGSAIQLRLMREFIHARMGPLPAEEVRTVLFVSSHESHGNGIVNDESLFAGLQNRFNAETFEVFRPSGSLILDMARFNRAKIVISPHTADLALIVACQTDARIVELANDYPKNYFGELSGKLGLEYHLMLHPAVVGSAGEGSEDKAAPIRAEEWEVGNLLERLLLLANDKPLSAGALEYNAKTIEVVISTDMNSAYRNQ
eukprot:TRINITY_DN629_c0_g1_i2.p1 TRINITY_DN629_c0_g1~~TRINITY_DN629_c0_g1_i2.p1  ORF type:complete len:576 (-),score=85.29 TRINITY_DN629_c0_g1_i2:27-1754(-)